MSLTTLSLMAAAIGASRSGYSIGFDPGFTRKPIDQRGTESALAVHIGGLRPHRETLEAARTDEWAMSFDDRLHVEASQLPDSIDGYGTPEVKARVATMKALRSRASARYWQKQDRRIRMAAKRRRGWR